MIQIGFSNESTAVTDAQVQAVLAALQLQHDRDFGPAWGVEAVKLSFLAKGVNPAPGQWQLVFADNSNQAGALGYHELTTNDDPIGFAFVADDIASGTSWSVTASHELLEMRIDPRINTIVEVDNPGGSFTFYAKEVCDACEDDSFGYTVNGILVSDFVLGPWFDPQAVSAKKFDFMGKITKPFQLLVNGYIGVLNVAAGPQWGQVSAETTKNASQLLPGPYHRRARRAMGRQNWQRSARR